MNTMTLLGLIKSLYLMENGVTRHVAGDVLDEFLHDLFIDLLEERDISNEFVKKLSQQLKAICSSLYWNVPRSLSHEYKDTCA